MPDHILVILQKEPITVTKEEAKLLVAYLDEQANASEVDRQFLRLFAGFLRKLTKIT